MTVSQALEYVRSELSAAGSDEAMSEARILLEELTGLDALGLRLEGNTELTPETGLKLKEAVTSRKEGIPLQYVIGRQSFMGRSFIVGEGVLIPRDDTEVAVRRCSDLLRHTPHAEVMDLCSGSGIIAITLALEFPGAVVTAIEKEPAAFDYLTENLALQCAGNVRAVEGDIFDCHKDIPLDSLDLIVSNPPYISRSQLSSLQSEVQREPMPALDGGEDGLDFYRCIARHWVPKLKYGGHIVLETGEEQAKDVISLLEGQGVGELCVLKDIQGLDRAVTGVRINRG